MACTRLRTLLPWSLNQALVPFSALPGTNYPQSYVAAASRPHGPAPELGRTGSMASEDAVRAREPPYRTPQPWKLAVNDALYWKKNEVFTGTRKRSGTRK